MSRDGLGEMEHQAMLALLRLGAENYTAPIVEELERCTGRRATVASVYVILRRLEEKGFVRSFMTSPGGDGGRDRRSFEVTPSGKERLLRAKQAYQALWNGVDLAADRCG